MYWPNTPWTWTFLGIVVVQAIIIIALESYAFAMLEIDLSRIDMSKLSFNGVTGGNPYAREVPTSLSLYIFAMIYWLYLTWDALRLKNTIQVIGLCISNFALIVYGAVQIKQINDIVTNLEKNGIVVEQSTKIQIAPGLVAIPCVLAAGAIAMSIVARKLYDEFAWTIYKNISADLRMKRRYLTYQIYIALLKFDFFFVLGFSVQIMAVVVQSGDPELWVTVAAIPITIIFLLLAAFWARRESLFGMIIVIIVYFGGLAYFIFKLVRIWSGDKRIEYEPVKNPLTAFAALTIPLILATIAVAINVAVNFGKGLKPHLSGRAGETEEEDKHYMNEIPNNAHGPVPSRMTIE